MPRGPQSKGRCAFCEREIAKGGVAKHLAACAQWQAAVAKAEQKKGEKELLVHLRVQADGLPQFWLDLEIRGSATLKKLDQYLRAIWLECCGHLSEFTAGSWSGPTVAMSRRAGNVFEPRTELTHIYDFGTSSITRIRAVGFREGKPVSSHPITLLARNAMPASECMTCGQPAAWLCMECVIEDEVWGTLCAEHAREHPHTNYGDPVPLVNSPRVGMCGYTGPADPPY